ncbi:MAG: hypothetical protein K5894_16390 [Lachnospiraceae bacterium]|nr:hypothetical protein [Lachnospiraceae bacterium]
MTNERMLRHIKFMRSGVKAALTHMENKKELNKSDIEDLETYQDQLEALNMAISLLRQILERTKYEYHTEHTDCIWYHDGKGKCPVTCSQYRDGWNDAMDYIYKNGEGYQPYKRK